MLLFFFFFFLLLVFIFDQWVIFVDLQTKKNSEYACVIWGAKILKHKGEWIKHVKEDGKPKSFPYDYNSNDNTTTTIIIIIILKEVAEEKEKMFWFVLLGPGVLYFFLFLLTQFSS